MASVTPASPGFPLKGLAEVGRVELEEEQVRVGTFPTPG